MNRASFSTRTASLSSRDRWCADDSQSAGYPKRRSLSSQVTRIPAKSVTFDMFENVEIKSRWYDDDVIDQFHDVWYSKAEYAETADEIRDTILLMRRGFPEKTEAFCYRGLEHKMPSIQRRRRSNLDTAAKIVLYGVDKKMDSKTVKRYAALSRSCQDRAQELGRADAKASIEILMSSPKRGMQTPPRKPRRIWAPAC
jgi:hypothetical protein